MRNIFMVGLVLMLANLVSAADRTSDAMAYLNKEVTVKSSTFRIAVRRDGRYEPKGMIDWIPSSYIGKRAVVIAIQEKSAPVQSSSGKVNALGETVHSDVEPSFDFVVRFDDGLIAVQTETVGGMQAAVLMPEQTAALELQEKENIKKAKDLIGKPLYGTHFSKVYRADASLAEMNKRNEILFPFLEPLIVEAAEWNKDVNCAIVRVRLPDGSYGLALASFDWAQQCNQDALTPTMGYFNELEVKAIRMRSPERGIGELALWSAIGMPDKENDYGLAGKQLIYPNGLIVYLDKNGTVEDVQHISR